MTTTVAPCYAARSVAELLDRLVPEMTPITGEDCVALADARGRVLARDVVADAPVPTFSRSAVDGYALGRAAIEGDRFRVQGRLTAGCSAEGVYCGDAAVRIFTGAMVPADTAAVAMQEVCVVEGNAIRLTAAVAAGSSVRPVGEDIAAGATALRAGTTLDPRHLAVAASLGRARLAVRRRLRVAVLSTGDELLGIGAPPVPGRIVDTNAPLLAGLLDAAGMDHQDLGRVADDPAELAAAFARAGNCDAVITSGGVSVGEEDHVRPVVVAQGGRIDQWRLPIKPGKPLAVGRLASGALFLGLPGNPNSVFVTLTLIGLPLLHALGGAARRALPMMRVTVAEGFLREPGRTEYVPVRIENRRAYRLGHGSSQQQAALAAADALMIVPAEAGRVDAGEALDALPIDALIR